MSQQQQRKQKKRQLRVFTPTELRQVLDTIVKIATVLITIPATWGVAGEAFASIEVQIVRNILQAAAVAVVDATWLLSWYSLDQRKNDPTEDKLGHSVIVVVMYVSVLVIALEHSEGVAGIIFRLAIGLSVARSVWFTIGHWIRQHNVTDPRIRGWRSKANRDIEKRRIESEKLTQLTLIDAKQTATMGAIKKVGARLDTLALAEVESTITAEIAETGTREVQKVDEELSGNRRAIIEQISPRRWKWTCRNCGFESEPKFKTKRGAVNSNNMHDCSKVKVVTNHREPVPVSPDGRSA
jgi:hypothetical protein